MLKSHTCCLLICFVLVSACLVGCGRNLADRIVFELLVRTQNRVKCACMGYATEGQCTWLIRQMDEIFTQLEINL